MIAARGLTLHREGRPVLRQFNAEVERGTILALVGPNGCGKTTALNLLAGALTPDEGTITIDDAPLSTLPGRRRAALMAYLPQETTPGGADLTALHLVMMSRYHKTGWGGHYSEADQDAALNFLAQLDLATKAQAPFGTLSGGEKQRLRIARCLCQDTPYLLLDEPMNHLDAHHQVALARLLRQCGKGVIIVLHDLNFALAMADQVLVLKEGRTLASGRPEQAITEDVLSELYGDALRLEKKPHPSVRLNISLELP